MDNDNSDNIKIEEVTQEIKEDFKIKIVTNRRFRGR